VCLDVLRALAREPGSLGALLDEIRLAGEPELVAIAEQAAAEADEARARLAVERIALALQASLLIRHSPPFVADAFRAARLGPEAGLSYGALPAGVDAAAVVERHRPAPALN
jgi:putative acyl-CoA dehydrogenase